MAFTFIRTPPIVFGLVVLASCAKASVPEPATDSYSPITVQVAVGETTESLAAAAVTPAFFDSPRTRPILGRGFAAGDYGSDSTGVVMLRHAFWQRAFRSAPEIIGTSLTVDGRSLTIVGIFPPGFDYPNEAQVWIPKAGGPSSRP